MNRVGVRYVYIGHAASSAPKLNARTSLNLGVSVFPSLTLFSEFPTFMTGLRTTYKQSPHAGQTSKTLIWIQRQARKSYRSGPVGLHWQGRGLSLRNAINELNDSSVPRAIGLLLLQADAGDYIVQRARWIAMKGGQVSQARRLKGNTTFRNYTRSILSSSNTAVVRIPGVR